MIRNNRTKIVSYTQNTSGKKCKLIIDAQFGTRIDDLMHQFSSEGGYGAGHMAFPISALWVFT